ncbi:hypothetical protein GLX27_002935 [Malassezia furfur]|uniref:Potassium transport protein n=1 Tax=Malassezia furfur TaxID=55194 RepID=A0ABY8ERY4_MALFU|nr:hypothetical protein CBS14141_002587 [Malassezia furfur]WFD48267.1 hypothetical protein GLX27_002935 [Malassezia furfur]
MLWYLFVIFVASGILYGARGNSRMAYIDCLFMSTAAMTVTGLVTVPVSQLTLAQQIVVFVLMIMGNLIMDSFLIVLLRRYFFGAKLHRYTRHNAGARARARDIERQEQLRHEAELARVRRFFALGSRKHTKDAHGTDDHAHTPTHVTQDQSPAQTNAVAPPPETPAHDPLQTGTALDTPLHSILNKDAHFVGDPTHSNAPASVSASPYANPSLHTTDEAAPHSTAPDAQPRHVHVDEAPALPIPPDGGETEEDYLPWHPHGLHRRRMARPRSSMSAHAGSILTGSDIATIPGTALHQIMIRNKNKGLGDFPTPVDLVMGLLESFRVKHKLKTPESRTMVAEPLTAEAEAQADGEAVRHAPYLTFNARVTGNSHFTGLTHAQRVELGGVEYRALDVLAWLIPLYWLTFVVLALVIFTPYMASKHAAKIRAALNNQPKPPHSPEWYWVFNTFSSITNAGMTLADSSFEYGLRDAYAIMVPVTILALVGNTAYPVVLRVVIWIMSQCVWKQSRLYETLRFLLDHPRRCFLYLFPQGNTLFLLALIIILTIIDWFFLLILDLNRRKSGVSIGTWVYNGLFQSLAIRSAGFQTFHILDLAPAVQMLQVFMMYLNDFPLTMAVRTTNVFEKESLGRENDADPLPEAGRRSGGRVVWGRFLAEQMRRQLAFDLWWIAIAVWIVLIVEQTKIEEREKYPNLTVFTILYEMISAYGTVGLSCGAQFHNTSMSGDFSPFSKLIMIAVMVRGRHRGLPVAIDRAIMLPNELLAYEQSHKLYFSDSEDSSSDSYSFEEADDDDDQTGADEDGNGSHSTPSPPSNPLTTIDEDQHSQEVPLQQVWSHRGAARSLFHLPPTAEPQGASDGSQPDHRVYL